MATNNYSLRSQDNVADTYATLPGMGEGGPVTVNMTERKKVPLDRPGCHPRRLIDEINHKKYTTTKKFTPHRYDDFERYSGLDHEHRLVFSGNQSSIAENKNVISSLCLDCHYHFIFTMSWDYEERQHLCSEDHAKWPLPENAFPWHHLVWAGDEDPDTVRSQATKYHPLIAREFYACMASPCTFELTIDISEPRLDLLEQNLLIDHETISSELKRAREQDPVRYESATDDWATQAPRNLNTYLKNMLDNQPRRSISKRNKRFAVIFGPRCFDLFRRLEFQEDVMEREDGVDEGTFTPRALRTSTPEQDEETEGQTDAKRDNEETEIGSYRAFIEDVRTEVQSLIHRMGDSEEQPSFIHRVLQKNMGCSPFELKDRVFVDLERYKLLGILPEESAEVVVNAYYRQWVPMFGRKRELIESLKQVANDLSNDRLSEYAQTQSSLFESQLEVQGNANGEKEGTPLTRIGDPALPVGLSNIGNTCYLNSLLQYLYTVNGVREIVNNFEKYKLELDDEKISHRKIGGNKMTMSRGEVLVSQAFVKELADLFAALLTSDKEATKPTQKLANAVLLDTRSVVEDAEKQANSQPPPLPDRPSITTVQPLESMSGDIDMTENSTPVAEHQRPSSSASASTLIDEAEPPPLYDDINFASTQEKTTEATSVEDSQRPPTDVSMIDLDSEKMTDTPQTDAEKPLGIDDKVLQALETQKRSSGTEQQDVEEVIGSIVNLLQSAIQSDQTDSETGIQYEKIMEMFFITTVNYTKKFGEPKYQSEISYDRSITAFPSSDGESDLYDCLASNFDQQVLEESKLSRYTSIRALPPVLHVLIQRTKSDGTKNDHPVIIPETLYLDRYMDRDQDSADFQRRKQEWAFASRLRDLKRLAADADETKPSGETLERIGRGEMQAPKEDVPMSEDLIEVEPEEEDWTFDGPVEDEFLIINQKETSKNGQVNGDTSFSWEGYREAEEKVNELRSNEWARCQKQLNESYNTTKDHAYRLEAVICHRGRMTSGHYWVWIRDFEDQVWRCYNDSNVKVYADENEVFEELNTKGDPYYLCYVRDEDKQKWVSVPKRGPKANGEEPGE